MSVAGAGRLIGRDFFDKPEHQPVKDAWQAGVHSTGINELANGELLVRLSSQEEFPDFQIKRGEAVHNFEAVMAVTKPLGKVYQGDNTLGPVALDRPETPPELDLGPIEAVVKKKAAKNYAGSVNLCVYVNYSGSGAKFEHASGQVLTAAGDHFSSVWLIARGNWSDGKDEGAYFICCAKESSALPNTGGWYEITPLVGGTP